MVVGRKKRKATQLVAYSRTKRSKNNKKTSKNVTKGRHTRRTEYRDDLRDKREDNSKFDISDDDSAGDDDGYDSSAGGKGMEDYRKSSNNSRRYKRNLATLLSQPCLSKKCPLWQICPIRVTFSY